MKKNGHHAKALRNAKKEKNPGGERSLGEILMPSELYPLTVRVAVGFKAKFTRWKRGEVVLARRDLNGSYSLRKLTLGKRSLPLTHSICNVPKSFLEKI